jgi:hypothetical protein
MTEGFSVAEASVVRIALQAMPHHGSSKLLGLLGRYLAGRPRGNAGKRRKEIAQKAAEKRWKR